MKTDKQTYAQMTKKAVPPSNKVKDFILAFVAGGSICTVGQLLREVYTALGMPEETVKMLTPVTLIFIAAALTALQVYDNIAKHAGAGTLVPITGFANAIASNAVEFKSEGFIFGTGVKIFSIAGPVIVYGTVAGVIYGVIYWIVQTF